MVRTKTRRKLEAIPGRLSGSVMSKIACTGVEPSPIAAASSSAGTLRSAATSPLSSARVNNDSAVCVSVSQSCHSPIASWIRFSGPTTGLAAAPAILAT